MSGIKEKEKGPLCSRCGSSSSFTIETRVAKNYKRRRMECGYCGERTTTREYSVVDIEGIVIKAKKYDEIVLKIGSIGDIINREEKETNNNG